MTWRRWSDADKWFVIVTPRILREFSREMPGSGNGSVTTILRLGFWNTISLVFDTFNFKLFAAAQTSTWLISSARVLILADGTTRYVSLNLKTALTRCHIILAAYRLTAQPALACCNESRWQVPMTLFCIISEIKRDIGRKSRFFSYPIHNFPHTGLPGGVLYIFGKLSSSKCYTPDLTCNAATYRFRNIRGQNLGF